MPRQAWQKSENGIYHIILRGINKQIIFEDSEDREKFLECLQKYKDMSGYEIYGYCLMDNHIHLLIQEGIEALAQSMKRIGISYVSWYNKKYDRSGHLFQDRLLPLVHSVQRKTALIVQMLPEMLTTSPAAYRLSQFSLNH